MRHQAEKKHDTLTHNIYPHSSPLPQYTVHPLLFGLTAVYLSWSGRLPKNPRGFFSFSEACLSFPYLWPIRYQCVAVALSM